MPYRRMKPIEEIYNACSECDTVIVPESPLADALNRRIDEARIGTFASTPRRLAAGYRESGEDRVAFLSIIDEMEYSWKAVATAVGEVLQCWEHTADREAILSYPGYDTPEIRAVVDALGAVETTSSQLSETTLPSTDDIAVIAPELLTPLERSIFPNSIKQIDPFTAEAFDRPPYRLFDTTGDIIETLCSIVTPETADRIAVVMAGNGHYSTLVEAAFETNDIPYYGGPAFLDDPAIRGCLRFLRAVYADERTIVGDLMGVLTNLGMGVPIEHREKLLGRVDTEAISWFRTIQRGTRTDTLAQAINRYEAIAAVECDKLHEEIDHLGVGNTPLSEALVDALSFYFDHYDVPVDHSNEGVLLADATSSVIVDRPLVFYLGMDDEWDQSIPDRPWLDSETQFNRARTEFEWLIQNGQSQQYLVRDAASGRAIPPCSYLQDLEEPTPARFRDIDHRRYGPPTIEARGHGFEHVHTPGEKAPIETVSQSTLNRVVNSPRDYLFSSILNGPDRRYFELGTWYHDFAEFYVNYPSFVDDETLEECLELIRSGLAPFQRPELASTTETELRLGLETIMEYIDANPPATLSTLTPQSSWGNSFGNHFDRPVDSPATEHWFDDTDLGIKGKIDLIESESSLLDFKSGRQRSPRNVIESAQIDPPATTIDYQAPLYLTYWRSQVPDSTLSFTFFYFLAETDTAIAEAVPLEECLTTVEYRPQSFESFCQQESTFEQLKADGYNDCQKTLEQLPYEVYERAISSEPFPAIEGPPIEESNLSEHVVDTFQDVVGEYAYVEKGAKQTLRWLDSIRRETFFVEDLDAFETFLDEQIATINEYRLGRKRIPVAGVRGEVNEDRLDNRDLLIASDD